MAKPKDTFLVANYMMGPKDPAKSSQKDYMSNPDNISYGEAVTITKGLKDKDLKAAIILNVTKQSVMKCRFDLGEVNDWETLAKYYSKGYPQYLSMLQPTVESSTISVNEEEPQQG